MPPEEHREDIELARQAGVVGAEGGHVDRVAVHLAVDGLDHHLGLEARPRLVEHGARGEGVGDGGACA